VRVLDAPDGEAGVLHRPVLLPHVPGLVRARMYTSASVRSASTSFLPLCCRYGYNPTRRGNCLLSMRARILGRDRLRYRPRIPVRAGVPERAAMEISGHRTRSIFRPLQHRERARQTGRFAAYARLLGLCFQEAPCGRNAKGGRPMNFRTLVGHWAYGRNTKAIRPEITGLFSMRGWLRGVDLNHRPLSYEPKQTISRLCLSIV
jgi:hypothetical protein